MKPDRRIGRIKYPSLSDIAEMKIRGYDRDTISKAEADYQRGLVALGICAGIRAAFKGVKLENGVELREGQGWDDYGDPVNCAQYREKDEKENWEAISSEYLRSCTAA